MVVVLAHPPQTAILDARGSLGGNAGNVATRSLVRSAKMQHEALGKMLHPVSRRGASPPCYGHRVSPTGTREPPLSTRVRACVLALLLRQGRFPG